MGCDIHVFLEIKVNNEWVLINHPRVKRDYALFEKMAGVRGDIENAISIPKGIPPDVARGTELFYEYMGEDAHTPSWFHVAEIEALYAWVKEQGYDTFYFHDNFDYLFGNSIYNFFKYRNSYPDFAEDVRIVFWFDN